ncbi:metallophosphoesterase family protein [Pseudomonas sp. 210_17 TE3656]
MLRSVIAVPGRPGFGALLWWFQGPDSAPGQYSLELDGVMLPGIPLLLSVSAALNMTTGEVGKLAARTFLVVTTHADGASGAPHQLRVHYKNEVSNTAYSRTLPSTADGVNMVLASCFYHGNSRLSSAPLPKPVGLPHVKMLCGDQIYLDLSKGGLHPHPLKDPCKAYEQQWNDDHFLSWMASGGNLCLPDDHEFWNNYPSQERAGILSAFFQEPPAGIDRKMEQAFLIYQGVLNTDPDELLALGTLVKDHLYYFEFPGAHAPANFRKLFCMLVLDTRTRRSALDIKANAYQFTDPHWLKDVTQRLAERNGPTVLVTSQSLLDRGRGSESNLADYEDQFAALWNALLGCKHQVLLLTGDIHWSRVQEVVRDKKMRHYEVVSSALSRISLTSVKWRGLESKVTWPGGCISAKRTADSFETHTYASLGFTTHDQRLLRCTVRWWEINGNGNHIPSDMAPGYIADAESRLGAKELWNVPIDLS